MKQKVDCDGDKVVFNNTIKSLEYLARNNSITSQNALNLINRQKAEIEGLHTKLSLVQAKNADLQHTNKELNIDIEAMRCSANSYKLHYEKAQAEIKMLKEKYSRMKFNLESVLAEREIE